MTHYENLLNLSKSRIDDFFANVTLFDNQFKFSKFNDSCVESMYLNNNQNSIKSVKDLKDEIPELKNMCKLCGSYYMNPRNKSKKALDIQLGIFLEDLIIDYLKKELKINAMHADKSNKKYPDCMVLGTDKGILAYFEVKYHNAPFLTAIHKIGRYCYEGSATLDIKKVEKQLEIIESDLDRPVFYLHWIDYPCLKGIFFETSEQVKENLKSLSTFERKEREGDFINTNSGSKKVGYTKKIYSNLLEMGTFEEFIDILKELKKNGIKLY